VLCILSLSEDETVKNNQRAAMIAYLEGALEFAEELGEPTTAYLIERALDEARSKAVSSICAGEWRQLN
jgi:hypothetical protein